MLAKHYSKIRGATVHLCRTLKTEDYVAQPELFISPPKWHLAHTTWFFEEFVLKKYKKKYKPFHQDYGFLFNSYYEGVGERVLRAKRGDLTRPTVDEVMSYRRYVDVEMILLFDDLPTDKYKDVVMLGLQHEQQHQELLVTDIKYILGNNPLFPPYHLTPKQPTKSISKTKDNFLSIAEGKYEIGYNGKDFCFDNELGLHKVFLHEFNIMSRLVTNEEYIEFIESGGYQNHEYWLMEGWEWVKANHIKAPLYWHKEKQAWWNYQLDGLKKVNPSSPVTHINYYEADAFARWKGMRLPTEFEWEASCKKYSPEVPANANFADDEILHPVTANDSFQFFGDVWEWTSSAYLPYPHYKRQDGAIGEYNGKFMVSQMVLRGGSCATPASHIRATYRNFFYPYERWQFTGIRLVK